MATPTLYVLDANVFIEAHRRYYAFDICGGFWGCLLHHHDQKAIISIDRVRDELLTGDALEDWMTDTAPDKLFGSTVEAKVTRHFAAIMTWVQSQAQFKKEAKTEFARVADGWIAAYAKAHNGVVVTHEEYAREARKRVPLPNVCKQFGIDYVDTFAMLRSLGVEFTWETS
jgi:predicted nucleic acid-binding protein